MSEHRPTERSNVARLLDPKSVAVVGASRDETKRGYQTLEKLREWGYEGTVYPINPKHAGEAIHGYETYASIADVPGPVDVMLLVVPTHAVPDVLRDCAEVDVGSAVVVSVGFSEVGNDDRTRELLEAAREAGVRLVGPNSNGLISVHEKVDLLGGKDVPAGGVAMVAQSGNVASQLVAEATNRERVGFSFYVSIGNEADLRFHEFLPFFREHEETGAVLLYVEGMADGRSFLRAAREFVTEKPIVALKGGVTSAGKQSAASHTASIAGNGRAVDAAYRQAGVVRVERMDELLPAAEALESLPPARGRNVGILSDGGGHATHAADVLTDRGMDVPDLAPGTRERVRAVVPDQAPNTVNPVDVLTLEGGVELLAECAEAMLADSTVDALLVCGYFGGYGRFDDDSVEPEVEVAERLAALSDEYDKPVVAQSMFANADSPALERLKETRVPVFESVNTAVGAVEALADYGTHLEVADAKTDFVLESDRPPSEVLERAREAGRARLSEHEARRALAEHGVPVVPGELATSREDAAAVAATFDGPLAMKVVSPDIVHKTEADGVALDVAPDGAGEAYDRLRENAREHDPDAAVDGVLVSPMVDGGVELAVGVTRDEEVGPVMMFGLGGVFVEAVEDVAFRALPLTEHDARELLDDIDGRELLEGARGGPGVDRDALVDLLLEVSAFVAANPAVAELDLNPVVADADGVTVLDAAMSLEEP